MCGKTLNSWKLQLELQSEILISASNLISQNGRSLTTDHDVLKELNQGDRKLLLLEEQSGCRPGPVLDKRTAAQPHVHTPDTPPTMPCKKGKGTAETPEKLCHRGSKYLENTCSHIKTWVRVHVHKHAHTHTQRPAFLPRPNTKMIFSNVRIPEFSIKLDLP